MKCTICKTGETRSGTTTATFSDANCTVVIKDVPADVCDNCGEEYVAEDIGKTLFEIAREAAARGVEVDIRRFRAA